jgi:hypothetical protein
MNLLLRFIQEVVLAAQIVSIHSYFVPHPIGALREAKWRH